MSRLRHVCVIGFGLALGLTGACFNEARVFTGLPCESDEWCGPLLCIAGVCGEASALPSCELWPVDGMACVPAGTFISRPPGEFTPGGVAQDGGETADPSLEVFVSEFLIDEREVTAGDYESCVWSEECPPIPDEHGPEEFRCTLTAEEFYAPMNCVSWEMAASYCAWLGKRLPTEAEWEKAARGVRDGLYPWGNSEPTCERAWTEECSEDGITWPQTSSASASFHGVFDLSGSVDEWVLDHWTDQYPIGDLYNPLVDLSADPTRRVRRGSSALQPRYDATGAALHLATLRESGDLSAAMFSTGFRCVIGSAPGDL